MKIWRVMALLTFLVFCCGITGVTYAGNDWEPSLWSRVQELKSKNMVDLTHSFYPGIPHFKEFPDEVREDLFTYEKGGFLAQKFTHVGQWGTHVDAPCHFHKGKKSVDQIALADMILPLVILDVHEKVAKNPDYILSLQDVLDWEKRHGPVPEGAFVAMRTDWSSRWPDARSMENCDASGVAHYPGWSLEALRYLYEKRKIVASGHETTDTDPGIKTSKDLYEAESYVLSTDHYQIELLAHLDRVPEYGAIVICTFPKPRDGSGFPARIFAILP
jgi:kynurenine formamidase